MHNTAETSINNYHQRIKGEHEDSQDELILSTIKELKYCTGRMIWKALNRRIENSSIARSLNNLKQKGKAAVPYNYYCPVTGVWVQWYVPNEQNEKVGRNEFQVFKVK